MKKIQQVCFRLESQTLISQGVLSALLRLLLPVGHQTCHADAEGPLAFWNKSPRHFKGCRAWRCVESPVSLKPCAFSVLAVPHCSLILFTKWCCTRQNYRGVRKAPCTPWGVYRAPKAPRCNPSSAVMQMLRRTVFIYNDT